MILVSFCFVLFSDRGGHSPRIKQHKFSVAKDVSVRQRLGYRAGGKGEAARTCRSGVCIL